jgi:hypothetical protein
VTLVTSGCCGVSAELRHRKLHHAHPSKTAKGGAPSDILADSGNQRLTRVLSPPRHRHFVYSIRGIPKKSETLPERE